METQRKGHGRRGRIWAVQAGVTPAEKEMAERERAERERQREGRERAERGQRGEVGWVARVGAPPVVSHHRGHQQRGVAVLLEEIISDGKVERLERRGQRCATDGRRTTRGRAVRQNVVARATGCSVGVQRGSAAWGAARECSEGCGEGVQRGVARGDSPVQRERIRADQSGEASSNSCHETSSRESEGKRSLSVQSSESCQPCSSPCCSSSTLER